MSTFFSCAVIEKEANSTMKNNVSLFIFLFFVLIPGPGILVAGKDKINFCFLLSQE
jgi:hypothetical protein